ncbi:hypothetical protein Pcinc_027209 [Petrolisthes cinctipes]|uniref:EF-hand domain-containing protein n=1 Tax=Petrolisthes cinctipes TaxID=88211 RepID=A0AAE1K965_PETCI|nr:hypothetical protein Pcinc_027209 [Petrolisthes cinctipes]
MKQSWEEKINDDDGNKLNINCLNKADSMNDETKLMLRKAFAMFDENKTGFIQTDKLMGILSDLGQSVDPDELRNAIKETDLDGVAESEGKINFDQFVSVVGCFMQDEDDEAMAEELREAFRMYDKEGNGYITTQTLKEILKELDNKLSDDDLDNIVEEIDEDGSGTVDFDALTLTRDMDACEPLHLHIQQEADLASWPLATPSTLNT